MREARHHSLCLRLRLCLYMDQYHWPLPRSLARSLPLRARMHVCLCVSACAHVCMHACAHDVHMHVHACMLCMCLGRCSCMCLWEKCNLLVPAECQEEHRQDLRHRDAHRRSKQSVQILQNRTIPANIKSPMYVCACACARASMCVCKHVRVRERVCTRCEMRNRTGEVRGRAPKTSRAAPRSTSLESVRMCARWVARKLHVWGHTWLR